MGRFSLKQMLCKSCTVTKIRPQKNDKVLGNFDTNYNYLSKMLKFLKK
jgi:hypothetical protein